MRFILVQCSNSNTPIAINVLQIQMFCPAPEGEGTTIWINEDRYFTPNSFDTMFEALNQKEDL